jgi:hypothetical protein
LPGWLSLQKKLNEENNRIDYLDSVGKALQCKLYECPVS